MTRWMSAAALGLAIASAPAWAHHAISAIYDSSKRVTVEGAVREFQFINPHPFLIINVTDAGKTLEWRLEMDNRFELIDEGMSADTLKPGDRSSPPAACHARIRRISISCASIGPPMAFATSRSAQALACARAARKRQRPRSHCQLLDSPNSKTGQRVRLKPDSWTLGVGLDLAPGASLNLIAGGFDHVHHSTAGRT